MKDIIDNLQAKAKAEKKQNQQFFKKLRKKPPKQLDYLMQELHEQTFSKMNCLECANCCKTTSPLFTDRDIHRIAKHLRLKPHRFTEQYLKVDEDGDLVLQSSPCSFLLHDNTCMIYEVRPKACAEYPHTDRKKFHQISNITLNNLSICPAADEIVDKLKTRLKI